MAKTSIFKFLTEIHSKKNISHHISLYNTFTSIHRHIQLHTDPGVLIFHLKKKNRGHDQLSGSNLQFEITDAYCLFNFFIAVFGYESAK